MTDRGHQQALRVGLGATDMRADQLPAFAEWLRTRGYAVVTGTDGYHDRIQWVGADGMQWQRRGDRVRCSQGAHRGGLVVVEFLKEASAHG